MYGALVIGLLIVSIFLHEMGHAFWMRRYGVTILDIGLGFPIPGITLSMRWRGIRWRLSPFLLGAYVKPKQQDIPKLTWRQQADIYGGGPWVNVVIGFCCLVAANLMTGLWPKPFIVIIAGIFALFPRWFGRYFMPATGLLVLGLLAVSLLQSPTEAVMGPVGIVTVVRRMELTLPLTLALTGVLNISLAALNGLPIYPLDAGQTWACYIGLRWPNAANAFRAIGGIMLLALLIFVFYSDFARIL